MTFEERAIGIHNALDRQSTERSDDVSWRSHLGTGKRFVITVIHLDHLLLLVRSSSPVRAPIESASRAWPTIDRETETAWSSPPVAVVAQMRSEHMAERHRRCRTGRALACENPERVRRTSLSRAPNAGRSPGRARRSGEPSWFETPPEACRRDRGTRRAWADRYGRRRIQRDSSGGHRDDRVIVRQRRKVVRVHVAAQPHREGASVLRPDAERDARPDVAHDRVPCHCRNLREELVGQRQTDTELARLGQDRWKRVRGHVLDSSI